MKMCNSSKSGFTLLEMLVASLLLGMLVTILTMVFNSSSIAWRTGKAGVAQISGIRRQLSFAQRHADSLLPRVDVNSDSKVGIVVSPWCTQAKNGGKFIRTRAVQSASGLQFANQSLPNFGNYESDSTTLTVAPWMVLNNLGTLKLGNAGAYVVGVHSWGPDKMPNTEDDINTWPNEVE